MILVLLPGLDGTGKLFEPFIDMLSSKYTVQTIAYPEEVNNDYDRYITFVKTQLPREEEYVLIAESFSGYIAYKIAVDKPKGLKQVVFIATFLTNPRPWLSLFLPIVPLKWLLSLSLPTSVINILLGKNSDAKIRGLVKTTIENCNEEILYSRLMNIKNLTMPKNKITIKSIYLQASNDLLVSKKSYFMLKIYVEDIRLYDIEGTHLLLQSNPSRCVEVIESSIS